MLCAPRLVIAVLLASLAAISGAIAQEGPGGLTNPQRDCQTITTCNFKKGGTYRGCLSSYSCRVCRFVPAPCADAIPRNKVCRVVRCSWG